MEFLINNGSFGLLIWQVFLVLNIIFWIFCMVDVLRNSFAGNYKFIWILVLLFLPIIGSFLYFFIGRRKRLILD
ncbi:MAG: PLD nuclease N-terminal domain-containing protein [Flavobacterium sp.]|jgi:hypothetical protein|nr:PLD nuclease N-terminal domain-containing protein [Flavobacterium sp.]MDP5097800.1 PLD nuclease N-terminal domain-containing protein [Flavobacterium sp.]